MKYKLYTYLLLLLSCCLSSAQSTQKKNVQPIKATAVDTIIKNLMTGDSSKFIITKTNLKLIKKNAHTSYYADKFTGRRTASGRRFNNSQYTAAHRKLPFGTKIKVTNESNNKSVIVEVTDRGPFIKGRDLDLTKKAFMEIAPTRYGGSIKVTIEQVVR
jgi:rare lipoprotein A